MPEVKDRLTIVECVYHQPFGEQPTVVEHRYSRELESKEQVYERRVTIGENWQPLDTGWIERLGLLVIANHEGHGLQRAPSDDERAAIAARVVEVGLDGRAIWLVLPGESMRATPATLSGLQVRCQRGEARCTIHAYPR